MPIKKEILNMLDLGRKPFQLFFYIEIGKDRKGLVYPLIGKPFRCINIYNPKASVALRVHPFSLMLDPELLMQLVQLNLDLNSTV